MNHTFPTADDLKTAHDRIRPYIHRTPIMTSKYINELADCEIYFKCENLQKVGAFKARGGLNAIFSLLETNLKRGVATHSSGNHAQAVAWAAKIAGTSATIVMPHNAPQVKKHAVKDYGATIVECEATIEARENTLARIIEKSGAEVIHPYDDDRIIVGQGTAAKELIEDSENLDFILTPVGGGGLVSGTALAAHYFSPNTTTIGCEPKAADDAYRSLKSGELLKNQVPPQTMADGLLTNIGVRNFEIMKTYVSKILLTSENEIAQALKMIIERMKIVIEPSCAVPLAALLAHKDQFQGKKVGIILSGGNVDIARLTRIVEQQMT